ncbi:hypothetical protein QOZ80_5BG0441870 [Eleusine coracana subsp. coracana]|nr:hypothetical protein QOZ80_5BG0441870 [Eleusine coracana subsp. coracana]
MSPKRRLSVAAGDGMAARPEKRPQATGGIPDESAEPPSPGRRLLRQTVLVVLFLIRAKDRNMDNMDLTLSQIGRVVREQIRHCLRPIVSKLESMDSRICALTQKVDNITSTSRNGHNHEWKMQETNQERNSAEAGGLATNEAKGKRMRIRLRFLNGMKSLIYHEDEIRSDRDSAIRIGIFDGNNIIKSGQLSSLKIEILALNGDFPYDASDIWTSEEFSEHIVGGRDGKRNVLAARVCDGEHGEVQEAVMNPVIVQDCRNKLNEKSYPPKLYDRVHRLEEIANGGKYCNRLRQENIVTVQDFLKALNKDPDNLARILQIKKEYQAWKKMVKHAQGCCLEGNHKLKSYRSIEANVVLFFDCVDRLVGAKFGDHYIASDMFDSDQQDSVDKLKRHAYAQLDGLIDDHVMKHKCPVPINTDADTGPSYKSCATQKNCSAPSTAYQVTSSVEGLNHAQIVLSCANANSDHTPNTHNYQCIGAGLVVQEQLPSASLNGWCQGLLGRPNYSVATSKVFCFEDQGNGAPRLLDPGYTINGGSPVLCNFVIEQDPTSGVAPGFAEVEIQSQRQSFLQSNHILEPATTAHSNMTLTPQQLVSSGAPGVAQGSVQSQVEAHLANSGQSSLSPGQWSQFQGNMPWNGSFYDQHGTAFYILNKNKIKLCFIHNMVRNYY